MNMAELMSCYRIPRRKNGFNDILNLRCLVFFVYCIVNQKPQTMQNQTWL